MKSFKEILMNVPSSNQGNTAGVLTGHLILGEPESPVVFAQTEDMDLIYFNLLDAIEQSSAQKVTNLTIVSALEIHSSCVELIKMDLSYWVVGTHKVYPVIAVDTAHFDDEWLDPRHTAFAWVVAL